MLRQMTTALVVLLLTGCATSPPEPARIYEFWQCYVPGDLEKDAPIYTATLDAECLNHPDCEVNGDVGPQDLKPVEVVVQGDKRTWYFRDGWYALSIDGAGRGLYSIRDSRHRQFGGTSSVYECVRKS